MTALTKNGISRDFFNNDPFSLARQFLGYDPFVTTRPTRQANSRQAFVPQFDVVEREDSYLVRGDLPGISEKNVEVTLHEGILTITGTREAERKEEKDSYHLYERSYGSFSRRFNLPDNADENAVKADLKDGVLSIQIGKRAESKPRKIELG
jgi:HSP20 family protein